jgi:hypothetical protein
MRGKKARALRRAQDPTERLAMLRFKRRPALYTHPIADGPGRPERRRILNDYRAYLVRAARARNVAASKKGVGTPNIRITTALKLAGSAYVDGDSDGTALL